MKKNSLKYYLFFIVIFFAGCDKTTLEGVNDLYLPDFSNGWTVGKGLPNGILFIGDTVITNRHKATGSFDGTFEPTSGDQLHLAGTFNSINVSITISADSTNPGTSPLADSIYSGLYDTLAIPHRLRLVNKAAPHDSLVLSQGQ
jgi:hypothetical protein